MKLTLLSKVFIALVVVGTTGFILWNLYGKGPKAPDPVAATSASNIAASSAFIFSARTSRTSAIPSEIDIETRCSMRFS